MCMYINIYICIPSDILNFIRENNASPILGSDPRLEKKKHRAKLERKAIQTNVKLHKSGVMTHGDCF